MSTRALIAVYSLFRRVIDAATAAVKFCRQVMFDNNDIKRMLVAGCSLIND